MFTYPFAYTPDSEVVDASRKIIARIENDPTLDEFFSKGKMLGVLTAEDSDGHKTSLSAFSGLAGGHSRIDGFVPPIYDTEGMAELRADKTPEESAELQKSLFSSYIIRNALGETSSVDEVFSRLGLTPPAGTGECAAPKLLNHAYSLGLKPLKMGEFWYGAPPGSGEVREHGRFYPSCTGKCGPLLSWMMRGLDVEPNPLQMRLDSHKVGIIHEDAFILAADKPSGMLSVPGKTGMRSLKEELEDSYGTLYEVHRLDMDTSGVIVFAKTPEVQRELRMLFERGLVGKTYLAHLCPGAKKWTKGFRGTIALPLGCDWDDRPRQMVDRIHGKPAITGFEILDVFPDTSIDIRFNPKTGRTHQLRVHAASPEGLGHPIEGDRLYGAASGGRLMLHASEVRFTLRGQSHILTSADFSLPSHPAR